MTRLTAAGWVLAAVGLFAIAASWPIVARFENQARLVQRVEVSAEASLFGEAGTPIGSPQRLIIQDKKAFLGKRTPDGAELVDEGYLRKKGIYPLQLQTVEYLATLSRFGGGAVAVLGVGLVWWTNRNRKATLARDASASV